MLIDTHAHIVNPKFNPNNIKLNFAIKMFLKKVNFTNFENYVKSLILQIHQSKLDKIVIIPIENSNICANNEQVLELCKNNKEFLYAVNLNPNDKNFVDNIKKAKNDNAVLVKIIPSYQNIDLSDNKYISFYELLKEYNLPLLVHTGIEHTFPSHNQELNNPKKIEIAAEIGVKIICAHCGTKMMLHEKNYFNEWINLALKYENVYGDLSAMLTPLQILNLKKILKDNDLKSKLLFGTDYPSFPCLFFSKSTGNTFIDTYNFLENLGFSSSIFTNIEKVLSL